MKVILAKDIKSLGKAGDVVKVANGHARNFLLPKKFAFMATKQNLSKIEKIKKEADIKKLALENINKAIIKQIEGVELFFARKTDDEDHLFGSVSEIDIVNALAEKNIEIHKSNVLMEKHLKEIGEFNIEIHYSQEIKGNLKVKVDKE